MCVRICEALKSGQKAILLLNFIFSYLHYSYAQSEYSSDFNNAISDTTVGVYAKDTSLILVRTKPDFDKAVFVLPLSADTVAMYAKDVRRYSKEIIEFYGEFEITRKLSPNLKAYKAFCSIYLVQVHDYEAAVDCFNRSGLKIRKAELRNGIIYVEHSDGIIDKLLNCHAVNFIDCGEKKVAEETLNEFQDISVNNVNLVHDRYPDLNGDGLIISLRERSVNKQDVDILGRVIESPLEDELVSLHANQMATIIAGAGNTSLSSKGIAWRSLVSSASFENPIADPDSYFISNEIYTQNHSYGTEPESYYGIEARSYDRQSQDLSKLVHVFSSGNRGESEAGSGIYSSVKGFSNLTGNMKGAKNVITVGAHLKDYSIDPRNSRGPAYDGRIKPELVAYGEEGSSDGAAVVSGIVLLIQDYFKKIHGFLPESALVKSVLIAGAKDIGLPGIDFTSGYGAVNAFQSVEIIKNLQYDSGEVSGTTKTQHTLIIPPNTARLIVALTWNDPAATAGTSQAIVNDVDATLIEMVSGIKILPWVLNSYPHIDSLQKQAVRQEDHINTIEYFTIDNPEGNFVLEVSSNENESVNQKYYLSYRIDEKNNFKWTYPSDSTVFRPGEETFLRWDATISSTGILEVSINNSPFEIVNDQVITSQGYLEITIPSVEGEIIYRMKAGSQYYDTGVMPVLQPSKIDVAFNCEKEVMLTWNSTENAEAYVVYRLGEKYMEVSETVKDTLFIFTKSNGSDYFAVAPVINGKAMGRSNGVDYRFQGIGCYYRSFSVLPEMNGIQSIIELSTHFNVSEVIFQRFEDGDYTTVGILPVSSGLVYSTLDIPGSGGEYLYRSAIRLLTGEIVYTEPVSVYFGNENSYFVFPNPVNAQAEEIKVLTDGDGLMITFFDTLGRPVKQQPLFGAIFRFSLAELIPGMYMYQITRNKKPVSSGRLVIQ